MSYLTLAIPTFNRSEYLEKMLSSIYYNISNRQNIEILIVDNCSTDFTKDVVERFKIKHNITYVRNDLNIGPDENFKKCISLAKSKYVWIFGDDDILFENSLDDIIDLILKSSEFGLMHLRAKNFKDDFELLNFSPSKIEFQIIKDKKKFIKLVHTNITFITANILNKDILLDNISLDSIPNNNLGQIYWNILPILKSEKSVFISNQIFAARQFNSGNYNFCEVFGKNFIETLYNINRTFLIIDFIKIFKKRLLIFYFPANIIRLRNNLSNVKFENCFNILLRNFKFEPFFWLFTFPAMVLPKKIALFFLNIADKIIKKGEN